MKNQHTQKNIQMKKLLTILYAGLLLTAGGCSKGYFDINQNPNQAVTTTADLVLPNALKVTADQQIGSFSFASTWMNYWAASGSYALSATGLDTYKETTTFGNGIWNTYYRNLEDYNFVEKAAIANKTPFYEAAAKIMKALVFQQLVDMFNNIPYSQALSGTTNIQPQYDDAKTIYESLSSKLDSAVTLMSRADAIGSSTSDVMFGGNNANWIKLANTLRLRILMRQSEMSGRASYIQGEITKIVNKGGGFLTADASVNPGYLNSDGKQSPFWALNYNTAGTYTQAFWRANQYPITFCQANGDPRYQYWYAPAATNGKYQGNVVGSAQNHPGNDASTFGPGVLKSYNQPAVVVSAAESNFLQAEAVLRGWMTGNDAALVNQGIQASFTSLGAGDATSYYTQSNKNTNYLACVTFAEKLNCIIRQKWEANNMVTPFEAWCDYRRLGLPADNPITVSSFVDVPTIPFRILYPVSEYQYNPANVAAQGTIDHHTSKIFWMK